MNKDLNISCMSKPVSAGPPEPRQINAFDVLMAGSSDKPWKSLPSTKTKTSTINVHIVDCVGDGAEADFNNTLKLRSLSARGTPAKATQHAA